MFPDEESDGYADDASDVGDRGEKNGTSWPKTNEVLSPSSVSVAVRRRTSAAEMPLLAAGNPPQKSKLMFPVAFVPFQSGPNTSRLIRDWRTDAAKLPRDSPGVLGNATVGRSILSTLFRTLKALISANPESRT